jgi:hypothetical protein
MINVYGKREQRIIFVHRHRGRSDRTLKILHNEELQNLVFSLNIITVIKRRRNRWAGHVAHMGTKIKLIHYNHKIYSLNSRETIRFSRRTLLCRVKIGKYERKRPIGRTRNERKSNIRLDVKEMAQNRV